MEESHPVVESSPSTESQSHNTITNEDSLPNFDEFMNNQPNESKINKEDSHSTANKQNAKSKMDSSKVTEDLKGKKKAEKKARNPESKNQKPETKIPKDVVPAKPMKEAKERKPQEIEDINFLPVGCGRSSIGIWHRPTPKHIANLKSAGVTMVVSLQGTREHIEDVQQHCRLHDLTWLNIPLDGANLPLLRSIITQKMVHSKLKELVSAINGSDQKILIHCAAGIHRTGTVTYSTLRLLGNSKEDAMLILKSLREVTFEQVGQHRIDLAEEFFVQPLLSSKEVLHSSSTKEISTNPASMSAVTKEVEGDQEDEEKKINSENVDN